MPIRCYTTAEVIEALKISRASFYAKKRRGALPFLEEMKPRIGPRLARYRAEPIDRYLEQKRNKFFGR